MALLNWYAAAPLWTAVPAPVNTTERAEYTSLEQYATEELQVISIAKGRTPLLSTLMAIDKWLSGWTFNSLNLTTWTTKNFPTYTWYEKDERNDIYTVNGAITNVATTLVLTSTVWLYKGHLLRNITTNEQFRITSVTNATTVVIQRWVGSTAAAIANAAQLQLIWVASERAVATVGTLGTAAGAKSNYIQKFLTTFSETDFDKFSPKIGGSNMLVTENTIAHALELEKTALFGRAALSTDPVTWEPYGTMGWVLNYAWQGWSDDLSGTLTTKNLETALNNPLKYTKDGSFTKIVLCGSDAKAAISDLFQNRIQTNQIKDVNLKFDSLETNNGRCVFLNHPLLDTQSGYNWHIIVLDPSYIKAIYPTGKGEIDTKAVWGRTKLSIIKNQSNDFTTTATLSTYMTMQLANANSAGLFKVV